MALVLLWVWCRPTATALTQTLAWELSYAEGVTLKKKKKRKKERDKTRSRGLELRVQQGEDTQGKEA